MSSATPKIADASVLHRALRLTPGYVPGWVCSRGDCGGCDLLLALSGALLLGMIVVMAQFGWWMSPLAVLVLLFPGWMVGRFQARERWGRARRRRRECVWCGRRETPSGGECPDCGRVT